MKGFCGVVPFSTLPFVCDSFDLRRVGVDGAAELRCARKLGKLADFLMVEADSPSVKKDFLLVLADDGGVSTPESFLLSSWSRAFAV